MPEPDRSATSGRRFGGLAHLPRTAADAGALRAVATLAAAAAASIALGAMGFLIGSDDALQTMGFDPDRARLITAMVVEGLAVLAAVLATAGLRAGIAGGILVFGVVFGRTFRRETLDALSSQGVNGTFDVAGWIVTAVSLAFLALSVGWIVASLARIARGGCIAAAQSVALAARTRRIDRSLARALRVVLVLVLLVVSLPVIGDMLNFAPDVHMRQAAVVPPDGAAGGGDPSLPPGDGGSGSPPNGPSPSGPVIQPGSSGSGPIVSNARPWLAWRPTGSGRVDQQALPGPWTHGSRPNADLFVYLPPGYDSGGRRYPVVYEAPWGVKTWDAAMHLTGVLDQLIDSGAVPPEIVVFASQAGGPYPDSECANSFDGREWFDRYIVESVVPFVDGRYRTIATPAARATMGFSQGGYCAPILLLRHPDVFATSVAFSGYFVAGPRGPQTPNAWRPFGGNAELIAAMSPLAIVPLLPPAAKRSLFLILSSDRYEAFYGPQYLAFSAALQKAGIPSALIRAPSGHAWGSVRAALPGALRLLAQRQTALGVFQ
jgi:enterochelin esterase-like enzyme